VSHDHELALTLLKLPSSSVEITPHLQNVLEAVSDGESETLPSPFREMTMVSYRGVFFFFFVSVGEPVSALRR
jgi:hypothetical protein